jgi:hypothetical protein
VTIKYLIGFGSLNKSYVEKNDIGIPKLEYSILSQSISITIADDCYAIFTYNIQALRKNVVKVWCSTEGLPFYGGLKPCRTLFMEW